MQRAGIKTSFYMLLAGTMLAAGCRSQTSASSVEPNVSSPPTRMLCEDRVTKAAVMQAAQDVLSRMYFPIEKFDVEYGIVRTRPLRGAQFFEFWRSDNAGCFNTVEANTETVRRTVELRVKTDNGGPQTEDRGQRTKNGGVWSPPSPASHLYVECNVSVQRLTLPENAVPSISQMYRMHSQSTPTTQRLVVTPQQQQAMTWIELGADSQLEAEILKRVEQRLKRLD